MGMFHSTSGKRGYGFYYIDGRMLQTVDKETMKKMLMREEELRNSKQYHETISLHDDLEWIRDVTVKLQTQVLKEFGYHETGLSTMDGRMNLNNARAVYLNDPEMNSITVYQRRDRSREGDLKVGSAVPNVKLSTLSGEPVLLHDYIAKLPNGENKLLVITAGSITWPPFRLAVDFINSLREDFSDEVDFLGVYISEAHAKDEWPLGVKYCFDQPKDMKTRLQIANDFVRDFRFKPVMLVDTMDNEFDNAFAAWPERFYIVKKGQFAMVGMPTTEFGFDRKNLGAILEHHLKEPHSDNVGTLDEITLQEGTGMDGFNGNDNVVPDLESPVTLHNAEE